MVWKAEFCWGDFCELFHKASHWIKFVTIWLWWTNKGWWEGIWGFPKSILRLLLRWNISPQKKIWKILEKSEKNDKSKHYTKLSVMETFPCRPKHKFNHLLSLSCLQGLPFLNVFLWVFWWIRLIGNFEKIIWELFLNNFQASGLNLGTIYSWPLTSPWQVHWRYSIGNSKVA